MEGNVCPCANFRPWISPLPATPPLSLTSCSPAVLGPVPSQPPFLCPPVPACQGQKHHPHPAVLGGEIPCPVGDLGFPVVYDLPEDRDLGQLIEAAVGIGWLQEGDEAAGWKEQERRNVLSKIHEESHHKHAGVLPEQSWV